MNKNKGEYNLIESYLKNIWVLKLYKKMFNAYALLYFKLFYVYFLHGKSVLEINFENKKTQKSIFVVRYGKKRRKSPSHA